MMSFLISLTVVGIIPLTTVLVAGFLAKRYHYTAYHAACICGLFMLSEFIALAVGISFKSVWVNLAMLILGVIAYCVLFVASRSIPQVVARNIVGFLMLVPVICALLASPLLIFVGFELLLDVLDPGHDIVRINERYECRTKEGHGLVSSDYTVYLYRHWQLLPFIEHKVAAKWADYAAPVQTHCDDVVQAYLATHPEEAGDLKIETTGK